MSTSRRIVVFTADPGYTVRRSIATIDRAIPGISWLVVHHRPPRPVRQRVKGQWTNLKRNGWRWLPYQARNVWHRLTDPPTPALAAGRPGSGYTAAAFEAMPNLRLLPVANVHGPEAEAAIKAFAPDLGLSMSAPILRRSVFSLPRLGTINIHKGKVPFYRGIMPAFWEVWNDERSVGCTVHAVDDKLDTGEIVLEATVPRSEFSTVRGLQLRLDEVGVQLMADAVRQVLSGAATLTPQVGQGKLYGKPTLAQREALERKVAALQPHRHRPARRFAKDAAFDLARAGWRAGVGRGPPRVTVLLYHRVSDDARDDLTVGVEQFERQMTLLRQHCEVLSLDEVLGASRVEGRGRPQVAVTFDDGYLDNFTHAAPILERNGVPAAFFVTTGLIGTQGRFPHDVRRGNAPIPLMTWDHLRAMRDAGFAVGSHTVSHIDCVAETEERVQRELAESRDALAAELGVRGPVLAYPYGGRHQMNAERLELVRQAGYSGCLSAYGGSNVGGVDRFDVRRRGVHWEFSDSAFLFACLGAQPSAPSPGGPGAGAGVERPAPRQAAGVEPLASGAPAR